MKKDMGQITRMGILEAMLNDDKLGLSAQDKVEALSGYVSLYEIRMLEFEDFLKGYFEEGGNEGELVLGEDPGWGTDEPVIDDSVKCCPECERPNQFGELCESCTRDIEHEGIQ